MSLKGELGQLVSAHLDRAIVGDRAKPGDGAGTGLILDGVHALIMLQCRPVVQPARIGRVSPGRWPLRPISRGTVVVIE